MADICRDSVWSVRIYSLPRRTPCMCLMTLRMDRVTFVTQAAGQGVQTNHQVSVCVPWGKCVRKRRLLIIIIAEINRRVLLANLRFRRYSLSLYDQPTAPLRLKVRKPMLKVDVMETYMLYGCCHVDHHRGPSRHAADISPPIAPPLHRMEEETSRRLPYAFIRRHTGQDWT